MIKETQIERIYNVLSKLSKREYEVVLNHICNSKDFTNYDLIHLDSFFNVIIKKEDEVQLEQVILDLGLNDKDEFLIVVYDRLLESILLEDFQKVEDRFNSRYKIKFKVSNNIMKIEFLFSLGLLKEAEALLSKSLSLAIRYEVYQGAVDLLELKKNRFLDDFSSKEFDLLVRDIEFYEFNAKALKIVQNAFRYYTSRSSRHFGLVKYEYDKVRSTTQYYKTKTNSSLILSYYYVLKGIEYKEKKESVKFKKNLLLLIELVTNKKSLQSKYRLIFLHVELFCNELSLFNFYNSLDAINKAIQLCQGRNDFTIIRILLYKLSLIIILNQTHKSSDLIAKLFDQLNGIEKYRYRRENVNFYESLIFVLQNEFSRSIKFLKALPNLIKDKTGFNPWIRIYRIICLIELKKYEEVEKERENFRKFISRLAEGEELNERVLLIVKLFKVLSKFSYNFNNKTIRDCEELQQLSSLDGRFIWNPDSPELILIHDWVWSKIERREYKPNLEFYQKKGGL